MEDQQQVDSTPGANSPPANTNTINETVLEETIKYLLKICPTLLDGDSNTFQNNLIHQIPPENMNKLKKFISDSKIPVLLIQKTVSSDEQPNPSQPQQTSQPQQSKESFSFEIEVKFNGENKSTLALVKRNPETVIEFSNNKSIASQLQVLNLGEGSPFDTLHNIIHSSVAPYVRSYILSSSKDEQTTSGSSNSSLSNMDKELKLSIGAVNQKIAELEISLYNCKQQVQIPEVVLVINPEVRAISKKVKETQNRAIKVDDLGEKAQLPEFLNVLQAGTTIWARNIQNVTKHNLIENLPGDVTTSQEINFWIELETSLSNISEQLKSPEVEVTLSTLKQAKRFIASAPFETDTIGIRKAMEKVQTYKILFKDFPITPLLTSTDLESVSTSIASIFSHLKKTKNPYYPIPRYLSLLEAIGRDMCNKVYQILRQKNLMNIDYSDFEHLSRAVKALFTLWDDQFSIFRDILRDLAKKKGQDRTPLIVNIDTKIQLVIIKIGKFRKQHEDLKNVVSNVLPQSMSVNPATGSPSNKTSEINAVEEINQAYSEFKEIDVLQLSKEGEEIWDAAVKRYNARTDRVETYITVRLRDRLATAKNANEMFRVYQKFKDLLKRPKVCLIDINNSSIIIRGATHEYESQLIERVKEDIRVLHEKFKMQYNNSEAYYMSQLRDLPPVSGAIIWARQIERQLDTYMKRVANVLGDSWESDAEGQKLKAESDQFRHKLNTDHIFQKWAEETEKRSFDISGRILAIVKKGNKLALDINFDSHIIMLFKEVRNLQWLGFRVPLKITFISQGAKQVYPFAVSLKETLRTFSQTSGKITPEFSTLVASYKRDVQGHLNEGFRLKWEAIPKVDPYVRKLSTSVNNFRDKVDDLIVKYDEIKKQMDQLKNCPFKPEAFNEIIANIQKVVDELNLANYSNLPQWVAQLDTGVESMLIERLIDAINSWVHLIEGKEDQKDSESHGRMAYGSRNREKANDADATAASVAANPSQIKPTLKKSVHEVVIRNQTLNLDPPLEYARADWIGQLHSWLNIVCDLPRIQASRYDDSAMIHRGEGNKKQSTFRDMLPKLPAGSLEKAYSAISNKLDQVGEYVQIWLQYQSLWDMDSSFVYSKLGDDLNKWQLLLNQIKKSRNTFDTTLTEKQFGPLTIDYEQVQESVRNKYDFWHKDILSHFASKVSEKMRQFFETIKSSRAELEKLTVETVSTEEAVFFVIQIQDIKKKMSVWEGDLRYYRSGQDLLQRQRFQFPSDWLDCDMIEAEWGALTDILNRRNNQISEAIPQLQQKVLEESKLINERIKLFVDDWNTNKPVGGNVKHSVALESIKIYEGRLTRLREESDRLSKAKSALDLDSQGQSDQDRLVPVEEEIQDLKQVWAEISTAWVEIDVLKETAWSAIIPRKVRKTLEDTLNKLKNLPNRIRTYSAFENAQALIKVYLKGNAIITDLHSEAIKDRHWKVLKKRLNTNWILTELTLGQIWDSDLGRNENIYREVITTAQGEIALEEFLKQVKDYWTTLELDLVNYQRKCKLVRGWDDLFSKLAEHLNSIAAMKMSPYYKTFEEEAKTWDDKLNRIRSLLDVWIDVQRRWVYLEGIFSGSGDINQLLPTESTRFKSINSEFIAILKKVLEIERIQNTMERLSDLLGKVQKALGEYLERQRSAFARFYFVGDEDLLEIIGNSKDIIKIQKHFRKMFAGLSNVTLDDEKTTILGMSSAEGEMVTFKKPISIANAPKIHEWLTMVETEMKSTLAILLGESLQHYQQMTPGDHSKYAEWVDLFPTQLVLLTSQIVWSTNVDQALSGAKISESLQNIEQSTQTILNNLADNVLQDLTAQKRKKFEHLITELVHQRDVCRQLLKTKISSNKDFDWLYHMRYYYDNTQENPLHKLNIHMANAQFYYGFEYLGIGERLVQTPLTDRCYLTLTQALESRMGGNPFGPAGTGKTETVKALGNQLGRFVLVFCCDEGFDLQAMSRIFVGLCQCGAWGCFDEFNRLEERILSAVSQQIQTIQVALKEKAKEVELLGKNVLIHQDMGIFVTMNPGYAGRSNLPDNLKKLFRSMAMIRPDREMIAQVMLYSQGFKTAEVLAGKIVPLFKLCSEQLSAQSHYDFGLRALKSVLNSAGGIKRKCVPPQLPPVTDAESKQKADQIYSSYEIGVLLNSINDTMIPKLVADDIPLIQSLLLDVFPGSQLQPIAMDTLREKIQEIAKQRYLVSKAEWVEKILQLHQILSINHGVMMVGPSGAGKTAAWEVYLEAVEAVDNIKSEAHVMDPKAITKDQLFGSLDLTTREWTDGLFTATLRRIIDNVRGESTKRHWIIFDGDVDPEWVENLNSLLDDNKLLTLPNGERLALPNNVRIMFEVQDLKYATLATISRCGMVWFSEEILTTQMIFQNYLDTLSHEPFDQQEKEQQKRNENAQLQQQTSSVTSPTITSPTATPSTSSARTTVITPGLKVQKECAAIITPYFEAGGLVQKVLEDAGQRVHIMDFTRLRALNSFFSIINRSISNIIEYNQLHSDFPMSSENLTNYITNRLLYSLMWGFGGSMGLSERENFSKFIQSISITPVPPPTIPLLDYSVSLEDANWSLWKNKVPSVEVETHKVASPDVVIPTVDTTRHVDVLHAWLSEHRPLILCGPPGSGKTMTLTSTLRAFPDYEVVSLNFSSATTPELLLKTFDHHCEYKRTPSGETVLRPTQLGKWLVVFCDEINLPSNDKYGTQRVITFIRQLVEKGGFWRTSDHTWIKLEKIQFVGACNPPTDAGRVQLTHRFLRHAPILLVDFPSTSSLTQIYGTFNRALMKLLPNLRSFADNLTDAMVEFYSESQKRFTPDIQAHYIYSPRELSRWDRALLEAIQTMEGCTLDGLVRLWAHEGLRLFQDRLVEADEKEWTDKKIDEVALKHFPSVNLDALKRPILYSNWLTKDYQPVERNELREYVKARLKVFYEEELDVPLVLFNEVLDHILRIDRVFRQPQGHALLIGVSGGGKSVLSRFVAWMNGLSIYTIKVNNNYKSTDFDDDLRMLLKRAGCKEEKLCFIFDESNVLESSFLERMNTLLASGEVPGLFEGEEYTALMHGIKETAQRNSLIMDTEEELYRYFTGLVRRNLHVVFTMNPSSPDFHNRSATSPALFNRCVLDWFGEWSPEALFQVGSEFTRNLDLENPQYMAPGVFIEEADHMGNQLMSMPPSHRDAVVSSLVYIHQTIGEANVRLLKRQGRQNYVTPRHYLDFINQVVLLINEKRDQLEEDQLHLNIGLKKLRDTEQQVQSLQVSLSQKNRELEIKNDQANKKLAQMVQDQQIAEQKQKEALELQKILDVRNKEIEVQKAKAYSDLEKAEPAILEAQEAVSTIKKKHLDEIKALPNPPASVKLAMESVCLMLTGRKLEWAEIRKKIMETTFITSIVNYDTKKNLTSKTREAIMKGYLNDPDFEYEKVNRASKACGPLVKWVQAQTFYSDILDRIKPLREEVEKLESAAVELKTKQDEVVSSIQDLEKSIATYKDEYATLIRDTELIKTEMNKVKNKVERSIALLDNLNSERGRWEQQSENFNVQMSTVVGDVLLSSAFLAYIGFFDQTFRQDLLKKWMVRLETVGIKFKPDLSIPDFLSRPEERLGWHANSLPSDELCVENAIMLKRFNRYPLVIDPSGQAMEFLMNQYADKKITKTSFLDSSFMKNLESSLRFGNPLLVQDVENIDPVLNPVLNKEIRKKGGRVLIRLGDQDVDFSPSFMIFLFTRDPTAHFTPDLCSRVTFVNFTVTPSSLQSQCLHEALKTERPEVHKKRSDLLKVQGEFQVKLRTLEKSLLDALNQASGNILDDDSVIATLETLKKETAEVALKVAETETIMQEISEVSALYNPMSLACSRVYFAMEELSQFHLYQFSLRSFLDIFHNLLNNNPNLADKKDPSERLVYLSKDIFSMAFNRVSRTLLNDDKLTFAIQLAIIATKGGADEIDENEYDFFLKGGDNLSSIKDTLPQLDSILNQNQQKWLVCLKSQVPSFSKLTDHIQQHSGEWKQFFDPSVTDPQIPESWTQTQCEVTNTRSNTVTNFRNILLMKAFHSDKVLLFANHFVTSVFGEHFLSVNQDLDMAQIVEKEVKASSPLLLCSVPGYDASSKVDDLAVQLRKQYKAFAIGSPEGFELAEKSIYAAAKAGTWVLLKNIHLAPQWLIQLEKKLHSLSPHPNYRLFMTSEIHPALPANLLRMSNVFSYENPPGVKANLLHTFNGIPATRMDRQPVERSRIYFLLAWFHAIIQERLRYIPLGWTKFFEFNDADLRGALDSIDYWIDLYSKGRTNIDPDKIPWVAVRTILGSTIYGGRIDNEFDMRLLNSFLEQLFTPSAFNQDFPLVPSIGLSVPEGTTRAHFMKWIESLPDVSTPIWLGLPENAESLLLSNKARKMINDLQKMQSSMEDDSDESDDKSKQTEDKPKAKLRATITEWSKHLPKPLKQLKRTAQNIKDPLFRCFEREISTGAKLIKKITNDFAEILELLSGNIKSTNYLRSLVNSITKGIVPKEWRWYSVPDSISLSLWMSDFFKRMQQLHQISESNDFKSIQVWLGGLLNPEAYITATRQSASQQNGWSLENLRLHASSIGKTVESGGFNVKGLVLEGAVWESDVLTPTNTLSTPISIATLTWKDKDDPVFENPSSKLSVPVYLNETRTELLFSIDLPYSQSNTKQSWYQRAVQLAHESISKLTNKKKINYIKILNK
ncbi:cytoplasmic dynein heavy chain [Dictyostelium purpureum]|uniref:Dynein heavy chain, cytoplasmic n=1 Tax=Dictyostelium purpureum TaxID=5786 RepID=F0ZD36_DICPU|nr:cytoplasmic dynein heavy chain [Dictyostelium purpureum]EGC38132.1 cytoplasmic dynein heavy chain [Dictyostelium purpureum]|eukprot:XP_003285346.1 cytoplasmic dynein heavy chain [Dictyostelium purpureum]